MTIKEKIIYECDDCKKQYETKVEYCATCSGKLKAGVIIGPFLIVKNGSVNTTVECLLCGFQKDINKSNLRRQQSCGCKPKHISIASVTKESVKYYCKRCYKNTIQEHPIFDWCCHEENDCDET